jgi:rhodanese-related sulfurtransferase
MSTPTWPAPNVTVQDLPDPLPEAMSVLDVREQVEWDHGHIDGAVHVPLMDLPSRIADLPQGSLLVVCKVGGRSAQAATYLTQQGYDAVNLDGGMVDWVDVGRRMVSETGQPPRIV